MLIENNPPPKWASWIENWCGSWQLEDDAQKEIEIGMLVVRLPDKKLYPGIVLPSAGVMTAGGYKFRAIDQNSKRCLEVLEVPVPAPAAVEESVHPIEIPTEGEVYEEEDEIP